MANTIYVVGINHIGNASFFNNTRIKFAVKLVGTTTCHSISYSILFHLTALLPLSIHKQHIPT
jgi:hypothetical protein